MFRALGPSQVRVGFRARVAVCAVLAFALVASGCSNSSSGQPATAAAGVTDVRVEGDVGPGGDVRIEHPSGAELLSTAETDVVGEATAYIEQVGHLYEFGISGDWTGLVEVRLPLGTYNETDDFVLLAQQTSNGDWVAKEADLTSEVAAAKVADLSQFKIVGCVRSDWARLSKCLAKAGVGRVEILRLVGDLLGEQDLEQAQRLLTEDLQCVATSPGELFFTVCPPGFAAPYSAEPQRVYEDPSVDSRQVGAVDVGVVQFECWALGETVEDHAFVEQSPVWFKLARPDGWVPAGRLFMDLPRDVAEALQCEAGPKRSEKAGEVALNVPTTEARLVPTSALEETGSTSTTGSTAQSSTLRSSTSRPSIARTSSTRPTTSSPSISRSTVTRSQPATSVTARPTTTERTTTRRTTERTTTRRTTERTTTRRTTTQRPTTVAPTTTERTTTVTTTTTTAPPLATLPLDTEPSVVLTRGRQISGDEYWLSVQLSGFPPGVSALLSCRDGARPNGFAQEWVFIGENGAATHLTLCRASPGTNWIVTGPTISNSLTW